MRIIDYAILIDKVNKLYIEIIFANVTETENLDAFNNPYFLVKDYINIIVGNGQLRTNLTEIKLIDFEENLNKNRPATYVFKLDNINEEQARKAMQIIFEINT